MRVSVPAEWYYSAIVYPERRWLRSRVLLLLAFAFTAFTAFTLHAPALWAQSDDERSGARALANDGAQAFDEKRFTEALDLFTRAESLVHAPPHLLYIARAAVELGQFVRAREAYLRIIREPIAPNAPKPFHNAQAAAKNELPSLEPRIPMLTVKVLGAEGKQVSVMLDGKALPSALIGAPKPTDPGEHKVQASAEGMASEIVTVTLKEGARETATVALIPGKTAAPAAQTVPAAPVPAEASPQPSGIPSEPAADQAPKGKGANALRIGSYAAFGVGAAGLAVGTIFILKSINKRSEADDICPEIDRCPSKADQDRAAPLDDDARSAQTVATIGFIAGGVGVATGVTLFFLSNKRPKQTAALPLAREVRPVVGPLSLGVSGTF